MALSPALALMRASAPSLADGLPAARFENFSLKASSPLDWARLGSAFRALLLHQPGQALRHLFGLPGLRQRQIHEGQQHAEQQRDDKGNRKRLAEPLIVRGAPGPGHDGLAGRQRADLALDDPLQLAPLLGFLGVEEILLEDLHDLLQAANRIDDLLAAAVDLVQPRLERVQALAGQAHEFIALLAGQPFAPEQGRRAAFAELRERVAGLAQQVVLFALGGDRFQLAVHGGQVRDQAVQFPVGLVQLGLDDLLVLKLFGFDSHD